MNPAALCSFICRPNKDNSTVMTVEEAHDPDQAILDAFRRWSEADAFDPLCNDPINLEENALIDAAALSIVNTPAAGMTGLAVKLYLALHATAGGTIESPVEVDLEYWPEGLVTHEIVAGALAELLRLNPRIATIVERAKPDRPIY